jgi:UDP-2,3-diacylglucosamine pyrophosphatase LpxH
MSQDLPKSAPPVPMRAFRSVFLSDFHLGARACRPGPILAFLRSVEAEQIYLVGDILDTFHGGRLHWGPEHEAIVGELERLASTGTRVVYLPGNHDAPMRVPDAQAPFEGAEMREALVHRGADGRRHLVLHGDQCDSRLMRWHFMTRLGSRADAAVRRLDAVLERQFGPLRNGRSPLDGVIAAANGLMNLGDRFERKLAGLAAAAGAQGVICGHSHKPALKQIDGVAYANCGDWIDSFTAPVEHFDGGFALVRAAPETAPRPIGPVPVPIGRLGPTGFGAGRQA